MKTPKSLISHSKRVKPRTQLKDIPFAKMPGIGMAQQWILLLKVVIHTIDMTLKILSLRIVNCGIRCGMAHF